MVSSIQTFGSFGNWHPHIHALVTTGVLERGGVFHRVASFDSSRMEERFRRLVLGRLLRAERLSGSFHDALLSWQHSGFSVHAGAEVQASNAESLERLGRYMTRAPVSLAKVFLEKEGRVKLLTPPDPRTGETSRVFDALDWVHAVTRQIPDARQHMVRYQGAYANRVRRLYRAQEAEPDGPGEGEGAPEQGLVGESEEAISELAGHRRRSWARLLRRIYEVDPLECPRCGGELKIVSVITDPVVIDEILAHRRERKIVSPFKPRAPPAA